MLDERVPNFEPQITDLKAERSRLMWLRIGARAGGRDDTWSTRLRAELPVFLRMCWNLYQTKGKQVVIGAEAQTRVDESVDAGEAMTRAVFERYFRHAAGGTPSAFVSNTEVAAVISAAKLGANDAGKLKRYLARVGVKGHNTTRTQRGYRDIQLTDNTYRFQAAMAPAQA